MPRSGGRNIWLKSVDDGLVLCGDDARGGGRGGGACCPNIFEKLPLSVFEAGRRVDGAGKAGDGAGEAGAGAGNGAGLPGLPKIAVKLPVLCAVEGAGGGGGGA